MAKAKTRKVTIAVAVGGDGSWAADGYGNGHIVEDKQWLTDAAAHALEIMDDTPENPVALYYVTAELQLPPAPVVKGKAKRVSS